MINSAELAVKYILPTEAERRGTRFCYKLRENETFPPPRRTGIDDGYFAVPISARFYALTEKAKRFWLLNSYDKFHSKPLSYSIVRDGKEVTQHFHGEMITLAVQSNDKKWYLCKAKSIVDRRHRVYWLRSDGEETGQWSDVRLIGYNDRDMDPWILVKRASIGLLGGPKTTLCITIFFELICSIQEFFVGKGRTHLLDHSKLDTIPI
jgi:hypothetical protein